MPHSRRVAPAVVFVAAAVFALGACAPTSAGPSPASSSPAPLTDEEAFAAAEETYRAYVDALNESNKTSGSTAPLEQVLTAEALDAETDARSELTAQGMTIVGFVTLARFTKSSAATGSVTAFVCLDLSGTRLENSEGVDVTPTSRPAVQPLVITFTAAGDRIASSTTGSQPC